MEVAEKIWTYQGLVEEFGSESRVELINKEIFMPPAPNPEHQRTSRDFGFMLYQYIREQKLGEVFYAPFDVIFSESRVVQPDILFISSAHLHKISKRGFEGVPDLIVEIISPSTFHHDSVTKFRLYEQEGVLEYWLIEPANRVIEVFVLEKGKYELHCFVVQEEGSKNTRASSKLLEGFAVEANEIFGV